MFAIAPGQPRSYAEILALLTREGGPLELSTVDIGDRRGLRVYKNAPKDVRFILALAELHGDKDYIVHNNIRYTFRQFVKTAKQLSHAIIAAGAVKGDRVAVVMRNRAEWLLAYMAAVGAGVVVVPMNSWLMPRELEYCLEDSGSCIVFADGDRLKGLVAEGIIDGLKKKGLKHVVDVDGGKGGVTGSHTFEQFMQLAAHGKADLTQWPVVDIHPDDDFSIMYTSGTTGRPKGAMQTHRSYTQLLFNGAFVAARDSLRVGEGLVDPAHRQPPPTSRALLGLPLFHVMGVFTAIGYLATGSQLVLMDKWDAGVGLRMLVEHKINVFGGVPALVWQIMQHPDFHKYDLGSITNILVGGAPATPEFVEAVRKSFVNAKLSVGNGYGLTETTAGVSANSGVDMILRPGSVGPPHPFNDFAIVEPGTMSPHLPPGSVGEILVRGPTVIKGYWNNPEATSKTIVDGWLLTGDVGRLDEDGYLYILDRSKDMLIRGGENVYCVEVEGCVRTHPAVADCAVVGVPDKVLGEEVAAVVVIRPGVAHGSVNPAEIIEHCRARM